MRIYYSERTLPDIDPPPSVWRRMRQLAGLSLNDMAVRTGFSVHNIGRWERPESGVKNPQDWFKYAAVLRAAIDEDPGRKAAVAKGMETNVSPQAESVLLAMGGFLATMEAYCKAEHTLADSHHVAERLKLLRRKLGTLEYWLRDGIRKEQAENINERN